MKYSIKKSIFVGSSEVKYAIRIYFTLQNFLSNQSLIYLKSFASLAHLNSVNYVH
jgi:hypothetical protein